MRQMHTKPMNCTQNERKRREKMHLELNFGTQRDLISLGFRTRGDFAGKNEAALKELSAVGREKKFALVIKTGPDGSQTIKIKSAAEFSSFQN